MKAEDQMFLSNFNLYNVFLMVLPLVAALVIHEYAHALAAYRLGDDTAKQAGRLTLNPLVHLDPLGTLALFATQFFGWAKPVPFNPRNLRNPVRDVSLVALAGPIANLLLGLFLAMTFKAAMALNLFAMLSSGMAESVFNIFILGILINISLAIFNLLPVPPLDGFKVISYFLPHDWILFSYQHQTKFLIAFVMLLIIGLPRKIVGPAVQSIFLTLMG
jgi:Zn-dependent protease